MRLVLLLAGIQLAAAYVPGGATRFGGLRRRALSVAASEVASPDVSAYMTKTKDPATADYIMQQFMIRVKDVSRRGRASSPCRNWKGGSRAA